MAKAVRPEEDSERINVRFPKELMADLRRHVPPRKRSQLIVAGTAMALAELKRKQALEAGAGAWSDVTHPDLQSQDDVNRYLTELRSSTDKRLADDRLSR